MTFRKEKIHNESITLKAEERGQNPKSHMQPVPSQLPDATDTPVAPATDSGDGESKLVGEPKVNSQVIAVEESPMGNGVPSGSTPMQEA